MILILNVQSLSINFSYILAILFYFVLYFSFLAASHLIIFIDFTAVVALRQRQRMPCAALPCALSTLPVLPIFFLLPITPSTIDLHFD
jgi:hypothetical protein